MKKKKNALKTIKRLVVALLLIVFVGSAVKLLWIYRDYQISKQVYSEAAAEFTKPSAPAEALTAAAEKQTEKQPETTLSEETEKPSSDDKASDEKEPDLPQGPVIPPEYAPIEVDFDKLLQVNGDIIGWIYCEDTLINYPLLHGKNNDYYLDRDYRGQYGTGGSIFSDEKNRAGFEDSNVIFYGHHMQNKTMFATLKYWLKQEYCDEHPVMWILTPKQDYKVELFSGYEIWAGSDAYTVFTEPGPEFEDYLLAARNRSLISADVELDPEAHYVLLSTCAYSFQDARTVLHGKLVPVDSAGGKPLAG